MVKEPVSGSNSSEKWKRSSVGSLIGRPGPTLLRPSVTSRKVSVKTSSSAVNHSATAWLPRNDPLTSDGPPGRPPPPGPDVNEISSCPAGDSPNAPTWTK